MHGLFHFNSGYTGETAVLAGRDPAASISETAPEFMEVSLRSRQDSCAIPAAVLHIGIVAVKPFENICCELLEAILKAVRPC